MTSSSHDSVAELRRRHVGVELELLALALVAGGDQGRGRGGALDDHLVRVARASLAPYTADDIYAIAGNGIQDSGSGVGRASHDGQLDFPRRRSAMPPATSTSPRPSNASTRSRPPAHPVGPVHDRRATSTRSPAACGTSGHTGDGGAATSARFDDPSGVALDASGDLYIGGRPTTASKKWRPRRTASGASR